MTNRTMSRAPERATPSGHRTLPVEDRAYVAVLRAAAGLQAGVAELLKPYGLTHNQYNVLRILRGAGDDGLTCSQIGERMITRDPDITRLLDRLDAQGLVARRRDSADRRAVIARITAEGRRLLGTLDVPIHALHRRQFEAVGAQTLDAVVAALGTLNVS